MSALGKDYFADKAIKKISKTVFGYFITHFRIVTLIIISIFILGTFVLVNIPRESDPEVKIPIAVVSTFYAGASPSDVENLITDEIENKIEELDDIKLVTSASRTSLSSIVVEFEADADLENSISDLKDKVGDVVGLPSEAEDPIVTQIRANDFAIITFSLSGDLTETQLKQLGEIVQDELESISGVSKVPVIGIRDKEYTVLLNKAVLSRLNLSISQVVGAIRVSNLDMPLGDITVDGLNYNLRTVAKFQSIDDLKNVVVSQSNGRTILLKDVAEVKEQFEDKQFISRISIDGEKAQNAVSLQVFKKTGGNILDIVDASKEKVVKLQEDRIIPAGVKVEINNDYSSFIRDDLNTLGSSGLQSTILIFAIMFIALSFREALIALFAIPITFFITFIVLYFSDSTLNSMTLYALVLSLGLLVDSFIIILEGIFHNIREGYSPVKAALLSVANYSKPLTAGMLTTIAAFVPMLLVSGILGEYLSIFPITIAIVLLSSLFVSLVLVPSFSGKFLAKAKLDKEVKESILERYFTNGLRKRYRKTIKNFLQNKKHKVKFTLSLTALFIASLGLLIGGVVPVELFPKIDTDFVYIDVKMPIGTELDRTAEVVSQVEGILYEKPYVKNFVTTVGQSSSIGSFEGGGNNSEHLASISVNLVDEKERDLKSFIITENLREELKKINQGEITLKELSAGPPTGSPIEARISGHDLVILDDLANTTQKILIDIEGTVNVDSNQDVSPADLTFNLDKDVIARSGLTVSDVSSSLRTAIFGVTATEISVDGEDIDVVVKFDKDSISSVEEIKNLSITNNLGQEIKLSSLANFSLEPALATIRHRDSERTISVTSDVEDGYTASDIVAQAEDKLAQINIPDGYIVSFGGEVEDIEQSFSELWSAMIVAVILIALILVLQFDSYIRPIIVLMSLPLMLIGVVVGMLIFRLPFSFAVFLGLISLAGIVVNDAIVLMDKTKRNMEERQMKAMEAVADAGDTRLQPILLTSITTIMGVVPLAFASEFWVGLSISIIFGLMFATVLQLFVIPMLFVRFEGRRIDRKKAQMESSSIEYNK